MPIETFYVFVVEEWLVVFSEIVVIVLFCVYRNITLLVCQSFLVLNLLIGYVYDWHLHKYGEN